MNTAKKNLWWFCFFGFSLVQIAIAQNLRTVFEQSLGSETASYEETIAYYTKLSQQFPSISLEEIGETDSGFPLHVVTYHAAGKLQLKDIQKTGKTTLLINNGIHPGEPDGIDASMLLLRDLAQGKLPSEKYKNLIVCVIPIYNIGGSLNRNSTTRVNQNGPESYGFRGNARNFDLNRDFIKADTKNAHTFTKIFHLIQPDIFIDTHVSDGADYQYVLTHLFTQHNKLGGDLGAYLNNTLKPFVEKDLLEKKHDITPYVNVFNTTPEQGFSQFFDSPRYSTGYATLFNTLSLMVETHMLKPYKERVEGTYALMYTLLDFATVNGHEIRNLRNESINKQKLLKEYPISWKLDTTKYEVLNFKGYKGIFVKSEITGQNRLKYDRSKPFKKPVKFYNEFVPEKRVKIPAAYILPGGWWPVTDRLKLNQIRFTAFKKDTVLEVETYTIKSYRSAETPYEGHQLHSNSQVEAGTGKKHFRKGDLMIPTDQPGMRYLLETLEPEAKDSFFNWNFFDAILENKEYFSPYVFEDLAGVVLKENPALKTELDDKKAKDPKFNANWYAQLDFIYKHSKYLEAAYMEYPVYRYYKKE
ncbi:MAG: M14 family metallopeptidase [Flavobacteriaceae bacterium]|nr:M14 family metallopeptidase [Flavobacteriaceae bacterium]